jgi:hypothetical protein
MNNNAEAVMEKAIPTRSTVQKVPDTFHQRGEENLLRLQGPDGGFQAGESCQTAVSAKTSQSIGEKRKPVNSQKPAVLKLLKRSNDHFLLRSSTRFASSGI